MRKIIAAISIFMLLVSLATSCNHQVDSSTTSETETVKVESSAESFSKSKDFSELKKEQLKPYFKLVEQDIENYYKASMSKEPIFPTFAMSITEQAKEYLSARFEYEIAGHKEEYIKGKYKLKKWKVIDSSLLCEVAVDIESKYVGAEDSSGMGRLVQIIIDNPSEPTIVDWVTTEKESFDTQVRTRIEGQYAIDLHKKENWLVNQNQEGVLEKIRINIGLVADR